MKKIQRALCLFGSFFEFVIVTSKRQWEEHGVSPVIFSFLHRIFSVSCQNFYNTCLAESNTSLFRLNTRQYAYYFLDKQLYLFKLENTCLVCSFTFHVYYYFSKHTIYLPKSTIYLLKIITYFPNISHLTVTCLFPLNTCLNSTFTCEKSTYNFRIHFSLPNQKAPFVTKK
jgi:hypothetical protein